MLSWLCVRPAKRSIEQRREVSVIRRPYLYTYIYIYIYIVCIAHCTKGKERVRGGRWRWPIIRYGLLPFITPSLNFFSHLLHTYVVYIYHTTPLGYTGATSRLLNKPEWNGLRISLILGVLNVLVVVKFELLSYPATGTDQLALGSAKKKKKKKKKIVLMVEVVHGWNRAIHQSQRDMSVCEREKQREREINFYPFANPALFRSKIRDIFSVPKCGIFGLCAECRLIS